MGGPSSQVTQGQLNAANAQTALGQEQLQLGEQIFGQSQQQLSRYQQLQQPLIDFYQSILGGNKQTQTAAAAPVIGNISQAEQTSEANIRNDVPQGAGQDYAIAQAKRGKGSDIASALNQIYLSAAPGLANVGSGAAQVGLQETGAGLSGLSGAGSSFAGSAGTYGQIANQQAQAKSATLGFIGDLAGAAGTAAGGKCWIAEAIYGVDDYRAHAARAWLNGPFMNTISGRFVMSLYGRFGQRIAAIVRTSQILKIILKPLFDVAVSKSIASGWTYKVAS